MSAKPPPPVPASPTLPKALPAAPVLPALPPPTSPPPSPRETKPASAEIAPGSVRPASPARLPRDELNTLAEDYGLDPSEYDSRVQVVEALHARKLLIGDLDREVLWQVIRWGRRPVADNATKEQLALEVVRIKRYDYENLPEPALIALARLRGVVCDGLPPKKIIRRLRRQEGVVGKLNRKRRSFIAGLASKIVGDNDPPDAPYKPLKPADDPKTPDPKAPSPAPPSASRATLRETIEERGLFGGLADKVRRSADTYVNQKLDEIEIRIDQKLDEIDKRLAEWRDKEVANRIRILKITLWASVIVSLVSLVYAYLTRVAMG